MPSPRIALAQIDTRVGDVDANAQAVLDWARTAAQAGADLVVFPEMTLTGYPIEDLALRASFRRGAEAALQRTAAALADEGLGDLAVLVGTVGEKSVTPVHEPGAPEGPRRPTNQAVLLQHGQVQVRYDKHHLPNYGVFDEYRIFAAGDDVCVIDVAGRRVGVVICEDIWQDGGPVSQMDENEVSLLVVLNASPYEEGKGHQRVELAARRAHEVEAPVAYVNLVGRAGRPRLRRRLVRHRHRRHGARARAAVRRAPAGVGPARRRRRPRATGPTSPRRWHADEEVYRALVTGLRGLRDQERVPLGRPRHVRRHRLRAGRGHRRRRPRRRERRRRVDAVGVLLGPQQGRRGRPGQADRRRLPGPADQADGRRVRGASSRSRASPRRTCRPGSAA